LPIRVEVDLGLRHLYRRQPDVAGRQVELLVDLVDLLPKFFEFGLGLGPDPGGLLGLGPLRLGRDPWVSSQVLLFGLSDALRLRFDDPTLDVTFDRQALPADGRPTVSLRWDPASLSFAR